MAKIPWDTIISIVKSGASQTWSRRNDEKYWSGWLSDGDSGPLKVTEVNFEASGLKVTVTDEDGTEHKLRAIPSSAADTKVSYNGTVDKEASLVFDLAGTLTNLTRFAFDFRPVTVNGSEVRFNLRYDP